MIPTVVIIVIIAFILIFIVVVYNTLIYRKNEVKNAFGSMDVMLIKRYDLIPNLVETVKAYMQHEEKVLTEITSLRTRYNDLPSQKDKVNASSDLEKRMNTVWMNVENYPQLKASENFIRLQGAWNQTEEEIAAARRYYNSAVTMYNTAIESFPSNILAGMLSLKPMAVYEISEAERGNLDAGQLFGQGK